AIDAVLLKGWEKWLLVGRRTNVDFTGTLDFADASAVNEFRERAGRAGVLDLPNGKDYFVFPRGMYVDVPPFGIGRMAFDDWMVGTAIMSGFPVVDCSDVLLAVHPNHDYPHIGKKRGNADDIPDAIRNRSLLDPRVSYNNTTDATWELKNGFKIEHRFTPARTIARSIRKIFSVYMKWLVVYCFAEAVFRLSGRRIVTPTIVPYRTSELSEKDGYIPAIRWNLNYLSGEWLRMRALLKERKFIGNGGAR
ncbi:MAG: hypothetical protein LBR38_07810, partial [Synergistaceae bacterium]|nr:hypothetical protein [Synergistaceae bacterium]